MDKSTAIQRLTKIRKIETLKAMPPGQAAKSNDAEEVRQELSGAPSEAQADLRSLENAGWTFRMAKETPSETAFEVVMDSDGHLKLAGRALTVKFNAGLTEQEIGALLDPLYLRIRRKLGFAENTFTLEAESDSALEAAGALNELPQVEYAEPNLVEPIQSR